MSSGKIRYTRKNDRYFSHAEKISLIKSGNGFYEEAIALVERCKATLHFQTYIFTYDSTGKLIIDALAKAVKRGVKVYLLVDAFGSNELHSEAIKVLEDKGILFRKFSPLFYKYRIRFGRRLHHKIILADETEAIIGGINVEDKYRIEGPETPWLDYAVWIKGEVCKEINVICQSLWLGKGYRKKRKALIRNITSSGLHKDISVRVCQNDWLRRKDKISKDLRSSIKHAHISVTLMASYFLPGKQLRNLIKKASKRGVEVKVILPGISDVQLAKKATTYLYTWMLRNNVDIYEWHETILHGKVNIIDDKWASIGSYNINHLSRYSSVETNIEVFSESFCQIITKEFDAVTAKCHKVTYSEYLEKMNMWQKFTCWCAFHFTRFLFLLEFAILSKE